MLLKRIWIRCVVILSCFAGPAFAASELKWESRDGYRVALLPVPASGRAGFVLLTAEATGIRFTNSLSLTRAMANVNLFNGSGVALGDYDGDGLCDIYLCDLGGTNALFRNLGGWKFKDVTLEAGVACPNQTSTGAMFADINGDGALDLLVTSMGGPNACFLNDGHGHFTNVTTAAGLVSRLGSTTMALADVDGNGTLDLYVANYGATSILRSGGALNATTTQDGNTVVRGRYAQRIKIIDGVMHELGEPDVLYLNDGRGKFKPVSWTDGTFLDENGKPLEAAPWDQGLTVLIRDINEDGVPDIYVCNDASTPDRCWINDGHGRFRALSALAQRQMCYFSMGADFADIDRDGHDDFLVVDMRSRQHRLLLTQKGLMHAQPRIPGDLQARFQIRRNTLFHARGDGTFAEIANYSGVASSEWTWSCLFVDVDLDGWEDILVTNGFAYNADDLDTRERIEKMGKLGVGESRKTLLLYPRLNTPNVAFHNRHDLTFQETGKAWGFDSKQVSNGMALADLDNDGDLDVVVNCLNAPALVYRNESPAPRIAVRLKGRSPNTQGIGARIKVLGGPVPQSQEVICGGRYVSGDEPTRVFAAGSATDLVINVAWRNGKHSVVNHAKPNHVYEIEEPASADPRAAASAPTRWSPLFEDASEKLGHIHHEEAFDDFARQPLLPNRLSQLGPGVAWLDLDGDGREDLIVGSGKGGRIAIYRNDPIKGFVPHGGSREVATRDLTGVVGRADSTGKAELLDGAANYEDGSTNGASVLRFEFANGAVKTLPGLPSVSGSVGALCLADIDGDGELDLFVGGRVTAGRYPEPVSSRVFRKVDGGFELDPGNSRALENVGLVTGACFTDLNNDGWPDLVLATEWGPVRVLLNQRGNLVDATASLGLSAFTGWWNGVTTGDFDGDGRMDIVAGNWGLNSPYAASAEHPVRIYFGELRGPGRLDLFEAYDDPDIGIVPRRNMLEVAKAWPAVREKFTTHSAYAGARIADVLGEQMAAVKEARATTLASMVFFNRGGRFEAMPLPREAQFAPAFLVNVAELDGDGNEDVFLSQNFFCTEDEVPRLDAGRGLWLRGDGRGGLTAVSGQESGIRVYGEQRGAATCDYDQDGRVDLVVTQNGAETKLYHNTNAKPGLRVRLDGPGGNPAGVGAQVRLESGDWKGPTREVHAGSGYWSQDSAVLVMAAPNPRRIRVQWPGSKTSSAEVPADAKEISLNPAGELKVLR